MKVLIGIPSPRDIQDFYDAMSCILADQLWIKYYDEYTAYSYIRKFFLKYKEYTHLCIIPDDLIVKHEQYCKLKDRVVEKDFQVLSAVFNSDYLNPNFMTHYPINGQDIIQVDAEGFGCCFIRRDVVEKIPFNARGSFDMRFAAECKKLGIPIYVDTSIKLLHLARRVETQFSRLESLGIGFSVPQILFVKYGS